MVDSGFIVIVFDNSVDFAVLCFVLDFCVDLFIFCDCRILRLFVFVVYVIVLLVFMILHLLLVVVACWLDIVLICFSEFSFGCLCVFF